MSMAGCRMRGEAQQHGGISGRRFWWTQAGIIVGAVVVYFGVRTLTEGSPATAARNADRIVDLESSLGIDVESAMQEFVVDRDGLSNLANWIYIWGHWPVIIAVLAWLIIKVPDRYALYRNAMLISGLVGIVIFATFPVAPPRLLDLGLVDTVTQQSHAYRVLQPPSLVNQYAAMPSFHAGWDLLMGIALVCEGRGVWTRALGCLLPLAMGLSVVVTANHYLLDVVVGTSIVLVSVVPRQTAPLARAASPRRAHQSGAGSARGDRTGIDQAAGREAGIVTRLAPGPGPTQKVRPCPDVAPLPAPRESPPRA